MNWAEERYIKVFIRDTPTWLAWPWQARAVAPLLMRKLEADGRLAVGRLEPTRAVALVIGLPEEVVEIGLAAMLDDGTVELAEDGLRWPRFEEAQESRKTEALRSREYRARQRTESSTPTRHTPSHAVTPRHTPSPSRTEQNRTEQNRSKDSPSRETAKAARPPRKLSAAEEFYAWAAARRAVKTPLSEEPPSARAINGAFGRALIAVGRPTLEKCYLAFLAEPDGASKEPPWPWQSFLARYQSLQRRAAVTPQTESLAL